MKKSEAYIEKIAKEFRLSPATAKVTYDAINKFDLKCYNSLLGDLNNLEERVAAEKELNKFKNLYSPEFQKVLNKVQAFMGNDLEYNIHDMDKEVPSED